MPPPASSLPSSRLQTVQYLHSHAAILQAGRKRAQQLRALHAAMVDNYMPHHGNLLSQKQYHKEHLRNVKLTEQDQQCCVSAHSPVATNNSCTLRSADEYPIFTPTSCEFSFGGFSAGIQNVGERFDPIDFQAHVQGERLSYVLDSSKSSLPSMSANGNHFFNTIPTKSLLNSTLRRSEIQLHHGGSMPKPLFELITQEAECTRGRNEYRLAKSPDIGMQALPVVDKPMGHLGDAHTGFQWLGIGPIEDVVQIPQRESLCRRKRNEGPCDVTQTVNNICSSMDPKSRGAKRNTTVQDPKTRTSSLSCDRCRPGQAASLVVPLFDSRELMSSQTKDRTSSAFSTGSSKVRAWFSRVRKPKKETGCPDCAVTHIEAPASSTFSSSKEHGSASSLHLEVEKELELAMAMDLMELKISQANMKRDAAVAEVMELRGAMQDMAKKVNDLEVYCKGLKEELSMRRFFSTEQEDEEREEDCSDGEPREGSYLKPGYEEFCHAVSEARMQIQQLCRALHSCIHQKQTSCVEDEQLSGPLLEQLEARLHRAFFEYFENVAFDKRGTHSNALLHHKQRALSSYRTYLRMTRVAISDLLDQQSPVYDCAFHRFCSRKLASVHRALRTKDVASWHPDVVRIFHAAARGVWMVHQLALAFERPGEVSIFRVGGGAVFDEAFMEAECGAGTMPWNKQLCVKCMVMPGFFVGRSVIKCRVSCSYGDV